jgi:hypothetical protein
VRNYYPFRGSFANYKDFKWVNCEKIGGYEKEPVIRYKRAYIEIFKYLTPHDLFFAVAPANRNLYFVTWDPELLKRMVWYNIGLRKYDEVKYKITKMLLVDPENQQEDRGSKMIISSDSENSDSEASGHNVNLDSDTHDSEEEFVRLRIKHYESRKQKYIWMERELKRLMGRMKKLHGPGAVHKYQGFRDELEGVSDSEAEEIILHKIWDVRKHIKLKKCEKYSSKIEENAQWYRRILLFVATVTRCHSCGTIVNKGDEYGAVILVCPILWIPICYAC